MFSLLEYRNLVRKLPREEIDISRKLEAEFPDPLSTDYRSRLGESKSFIREVTEGAFFYLYDIAEMLGADDIARRGPKTESRVVVA